MNGPALAAQFSSATDEWATPQWLFDQLDAEFGFTIDLAASDANAKCCIYFTRDDDSLTRSWAPRSDVADDGPAYLNPPYGRQIGKWVRKARTTAQRGRTVVCLLPARTDTRWWHDDVLPYGEVRFLRGRLKFGDAKTAAPFPSAVVVFRAKRTRQATSLRQLPLFAGATT